MTVTRIEANRLIPGRGEVVENAVVVLEDASIGFAGPATDAPSAVKDTETVTTDTVMPGLWECHGHFIGTYTANIAEIHTLRPQLGAMRVTGDAHRALMAGFTSVREMGGMGTFLARAIDEGQVVGPHVYASGAMLSMTAGHGDEHGMELDVARASVARQWARTTSVTAPTNAGRG